MVGLGGILWSRVKTSWQVALTFATSDYTGTLPILPNCCKRARVNLFSDLGVGCEH